MPDINAGSFSCKGLSDLEKVLEGFSDRLARNVMVGALRAGAQVVRKEAQQRCPESAEAHLLSSGKGRMKTWIAPGSLKKLGIKVRKPKRTQTERPLSMQVYVSKKYWYGRFVEMGHVITRKRRTRGEKRIAKEDWKGGFVPAKPFMRPAFDSTKEAAVDAVRDYVGPRIKKEAAKRGN